MTTGCFFPVQKFRALIASAFSEKIEQISSKIDLVAGCATAGIPHATTLADKLSVPLAYVRSSSKKHGMQNLIEGGAFSGARACLIEDVFSTGGSSIKAAKALMEAKVEVVLSASIFSYGFSQCDEAFCKENLQSYSIIFFSELIDFAKEEEIINLSLYDSLKNWWDAPFEWGEKNGWGKCTS